MQYIKIWALKNSGFSNSLFLNQLFYLSLLQNIINIKWEKNNNNN